jgi:hypothetical protein
MRIVDITAQAQRATGQTAERWLMWIAGRNRTTNAVEALGVWTGPDVQTVTVTDMYTRNAASRVFYGAGEMLGLSALPEVAGLEVRPVRVALSNVGAAVETIVRVYDARNARVQIWKLSLSPTTGLPVGVPEPRFKGFCNRAPQPRPVPGGAAILEMELVPVTRLLTIPNPRKRSDASQRLRSDDRFFRYLATAGSRDIPWGQENTRK